MHTVRALLRKAAAAFWLCLVVFCAAQALAQVTEGPSEAMDPPTPVPTITPPDAATLAAVESAAQGPDIPGIDMAEWEQVALRAEVALDRDRISNESFEVLRSLLADYRGQFLEAQELNAGRIETLRTQIAALGVPAEGVEELPSVIARRGALEAQLAELRAPVLAADEARTRANGLIFEIDQVIRMRQAERLTYLGPSPLNPAHWIDGLRDVRLAYTRVEREVERNLNNQVRRELIYRSTPVALFFLICGLLLLIWGRSWAGKSVNWVMARGRRGARVWSSLLAFGQFLLPLVGVVAVVIAISALQILGTRGQLLLENVIGWAAIILAVRWLGDRLFSKHDEERLLPMQKFHRREARFYTTTLAVIYVGNLFAQQLTALNGFDEESASVVGFPVLVLAGLVLFRLGGLLARKVDLTRDDPEARVPMRMLYVAALGRIARLIAIVSPILAAIGYGYAARALLYPAIATLALAGLLIVLQRFISELYRYLARQPDDAEDSLIVVLVGFMLVLAAVPLGALIWGARVADLTEVWARFGEGFQFGGAQFRPTEFLIIILVFGVLYSATRLIQGALRNTVLPKTKLDTGGRNAVVSGVGYIGVGLAGVLSVTAAGIDLSALAFIATALSVGIGFGLQNIVQNFVSGIILLIERPIAEGDWVEVNGNMGYVRDISVRSTRIETFDRTDVIVPNGDFISGTVTNYTRGNSIGRVIVPVGVAYGSDVRKVEGILMRIAREHDMVLMNPAPVIIFQGFGADSLDFEIRAILRDVNYMLSVKSELNYKIYDAFAEAGIEIPFAQRDVWLRNPEVLRPQADTPPAERAKERSEPVGRPPETLSPRVADRDLAGHGASDGDGEGDAR